MSDFFAWFCCRGLRSLVDWNRCYPPQVSFFGVEACEASWIEMSSYSWMESFTLSSRLAKPRGLKCLRNRQTLPCQSRGLRSLVDWNIEGIAKWLTALCRGLRSLVDWNKKHDNAVRKGFKSRLAKPRGLKYLINCDAIIKIRSRLAKPRGLKFPLTPFPPRLLMSRLAKPRGLKF